MTFVTTLLYKVLLFNSFGHNNRSVNTNFHLYLSNDSERLKSSDWLA